MPSRSAAYLKKHIEEEIGVANVAIAEGDLATAFRHLERAHILAQSRTHDHTRIHWRMLKLGWTMRSWREIFGQVIRIVGAATKTPFGIYPTGNTGGSNVYFFRRMPIDPELQEILEKARID